MPGSAPIVVAIYSETGGATKTTTAVSLANVIATAGRRTTLIDLDPRGAATKWLMGEEEAFAEGVLDVGAILGNEDPVGWADQIALPLSDRWSPNLRFICSRRSVAVREQDRVDGGDVRLKQSLEGTDSEVVIIDCPNRQGGPLTMAAFTAAQGVIFAAKPDEDGVDGVVGGRRSFAGFVKHRRVLGAPADLKDMGIVVGQVNSSAVTPYIERMTIDTLNELGGVMTPYVPHRTVVKESRAAHDWYGNFRKGRDVVAAYEAIAEKVFA